MDKKNFCFDSQQVDRLAQLVKHELIELDILMEVTCLSDSVKSHLRDEHKLYGAILDVLLNRG